MLVSTLDLVLSTLDSRQLPRLLIVLAMPQQFEPHSSAKLLWGNSRWNFMVSTWKHIWNMLSEHGIYCLSDKKRIWPHVSSYLSSPSCGCTGLIIHGTLVITSSLTLTSRPRVSSYDSNRLFIHRTFVISNDCKLGLDLEKNCKTFINIIK